MIYANIGRGTNFFYQIELLLFKLSGYHLRTLQLYNFTISYIFFVLWNKLLGYLVNFQKKKSKKEKEIQTVSSK